MFRRNINISLRSKGIICDECCVCVSVYVYSYNVMFSARLELFDLSDLNVCNLTNTIDLMCLWGASNGMS